MWNCCRKADTQMIEVYFSLSIIYHSCVYVNPNKFTSQSKCFGTFLSPPTCFLASQLSPSLISINGHGIWKGGNALSLFLCSEFLALMQVTKHSEILACDVKGIQDILLWKNTLLLCPLLLLAESLNHFLWMKRKRAKSRRVIMTSHSKVPCFNSRP